MSQQIWFLCACGCRVKKEDSKMLENVRLPDGSIGRQSCCPKHRRDGVKIKRIIRCPDCEAEGVHEDIILEIDDRSIYCAKHTKKRRLKSNRKAMDRIRKGLPPIIATKKFPKPVKSVPRPDPSVIPFFEDRCGGFTAITQEFRRQLAMEEI